MSKKKREPSEKAVIQIATSVLDLATRLKAVEREVAITKRIRQDVAEQYRLEEKLATHRAEARRFVIASEPPRQSWWERWLTALGIGAIEQMRHATKTAANVAELKNFEEV